MVKTDSQPTSLPDKYVDFFCSGEPKDTIHYWRCDNAISAALEMVVWQPDGQFKKAFLPVTARLEKEFSGKLIYHKPAPKEDDVRSLDHEELREYPNVYHPGPIYAVGVTPPMYRRQNHGWGDLQEALVFVEKTIRGPKAMIIPHKHVSEETWQCAMEDLAINTVHPAYLDRLHCRVFTSYSDHTLAPHDLHL